MLHLIKLFCDTLIEHQEQRQAAWQGGIYCPACQTIHGRCGDAIFPLYVMYIETGEQKYKQAARMLVNYMRKMQLPDGSWLNEKMGTWKGTTVFQLLSLCHSYDVLNKAEMKADMAMLEPMIDTSANWVSQTFGDGGETNVNYFISSATALKWVSIIKPNPHYEQQAASLMERYGLQQLTADGYLLGEKTTGRPYTRVTSTIDIGYNLDMSLGMMAEYALLTGDKRIKSETVRALRAHMQHVLPDGSIDNSFGSRNYKWTMYGSKTAHGSQMAFMLLGDEDPLFLRAAELNLQYMSREANNHNGFLGYGPHYWEMFEHGCIHSVFNRADALAAAYMYGCASSGATEVKENITDKRIEHPAVLQLPLEQSFGVKKLSSLSVHQIRQWKWYASVSCFNVHHAVTGGSAGYLWHEQLGPLQLGSVTGYERYEAYNMPEKPGSRDDITAPRIEVECGARKGSNLFDYDAVAIADQSSTTVLGRLKHEQKGIVTDFGIHYSIKYDFLENQCIKTYELDVLLPCDRLSIVEPILCGAAGKVSLQNESVCIQLPQGSMEIYGCSQSLKLDPAKLNSRLTNVFPSVITLPLYWSKKQVKPGKYTISIIIGITEN